MLHLELVPDKGFAQRKSEVYLGERVDKEFDDLLIRLNAIGCAYSINESSCYGGFALDETGDKLIHQVPEEEPLLGWRFYEGHLGFGLDRTQEGEKFLEGIKEIIRRNGVYTHLTNSYPRHQQGLDLLRPNEFHFGIMPMNGKNIEELPITIDLSSRQEALQLAGIRDQIWKEVVKLVSSYHY